MKRKHRHTLGLVLKRTHFFETIAVFLIVFFIAAFVIYRCEDVFPTYGAALWYCFELVTTVGFGGLVAVTRIGRILSILLSAYSIGMIAIITSTVVTYHQIKIKSQEDSIALFMDKLENLPKLSREELADISERIRNLRS